MHDTIFVDTSFFLALVNVDDDKHASAVKKYVGLKKIVNRTRLVFTDYIFDEVMTGLKRSKVNAEEIEKFGDDLLSSKYYTMYPVYEVHFREAWAMLKKHRDKEWSFTDCTSFVVMHELDITLHLSFDEHFDQARFHAWGPSS